jgi:predicted nucleic acid-binding protein
MIVLDTNVISEITRLAPDSRVMDWYRKQDPADLATTATNEAEILAGLALLPQGRRKDGLIQASAAMLNNLGYGIFPFDRDAAQIYPLIVLQRRAMRLATEVADGQIAAIARSRGASIATRNISDFEHASVQLINPWTP